MKREFLALFFLATAACSDPNNSLMIINESEDKITSIKVKAAGKIHEVNEIGVSNSIELQGLSSSDLAPEVSWNWRGKKFTDRACYILSNGNRTQGMAAIKGEKLATLSCLPEREQ